MSRVAKMPVKIPAGVQVTNADGTVTVKGAKTSLNFTLPEAVAVEIKDGTLSVTEASGNRNPANCDLMPSCRAIWRARSVPSRAATLISTNVFLPAASTPTPNVISSASERNFSI